MTKRPDVTAALTALGPLPETVHLVSIEPGKNRYRFYTLARQTTLWQEGVLVQFWGRLGKPGRTRVHFLGNEQQLQTAMLQLLRRRLQHGYQVVEVAGK